MKPNVKRLFLRRLKQLEELEPRLRPNAGICNSLLMLDFDGALMDLGYCEQWLWPYFTTWPEFSGRPGYPIKGLGMLTPIDRYEGASKAKTLWTGGEYAKSRQDLLRHIIREIEKELI